MALFVRKGVTAIVSLMTWTFWVLPLAYFYLPKSARAYLVPQSVEIHDLFSGPISVDPTCPQPVHSNQIDPVGYLDVCTCICTLYVYTYTYIDIHLHIYIIT